MSDRDLIIDDDSEKEKENVLINSNTVFNDLKMADIKSDCNQIMLLNDNKAGMVGLDKASINKIIYEASKGSLFFENEQRKETILQARIENQLKQAREITPEQLESGLAKADDTIRSLEEEREMSRTIVHIDMDAFYAAVEILAKPHFKDVPMAVGSNHMLSTSNYAARRFGVRAGMPGFIAKKLCPRLVILPSNFDEYRKYSTLFGKVLKEYDPNYSKMGLDEAYLDITNYLKGRAGTSNGCTWAELEWEVVEEMRQKIFELTNLTSSAGIAPNSMLAKVCSDMNKPNGQFRIEKTKEAVLEFIKDLPIRKISGIGKVCEQMLKSLDIQTCNQLINKRSILYQLYSLTSFEHFMRVGLGVGYGGVERDSERKSMSVERTFEDTSETNQLEEICKKLCKNLVDDLTEESWATKTITLKIKEITFQVKTRAKTLTYHTQSYDIIFNAALNLLKVEVKHSKGQLKLRLMGVRASSLIPSSEVPKSTQMSLLEVFKKRNKHDSDDNDHMKDVSSSSSSSSPITSYDFDQSLSEFLEPLGETETDLNTFEDVTNNYANSLDTHSIVSSNNRELFTNNCETPPTCPICSTILPSDDESFINKHLDDCLSTTYINREFNPHSIINSSADNSGKHKDVESSTSHPRKHLPSPQKVANPKAPQKRKKIKSPGNTSLSKFFRPS